MSKTLLILLLMLSVGASAAAQAQGYGAALLRCESKDYRDALCPAPTRDGVVLVGQLSRSACIEGRTWGYNRRGVWVSRGCAADFQLLDRRGDGFRPSPPGAGPPSVRPPDRNPGIWRELLVTCESHRYAYNYCAVPVRSEVRLLRQTSRSACVYGRSWGYDRRGVWVDGGCQGEFSVY